MYQFSRAIYRELAPHISRSPNGCHDIDNHVAVLHACEASIERLACDRHYFAKPARTLFGDIRRYFNLTEQRHVQHVVAAYMGFAEQYVAEHPLVACDLTGERLHCRATTRRGTPCQRTPLADTGYCPSHQHLAETEDSEQLVAA